MRKGGFYMSERIGDKIIEIEKYLEELYEIIPKSFEDYKMSLEKRAACERYFEKIIEAVIGLCFIFIREKNFKMPEDEEKVFDILEQNQIISKELTEKLKEIKGMRNFIIHQYEKIDDELVFEAITEALEKDVNEFIKSVEKLDE